MKIRDLKRYGAGGLVALTLVVLMVPAATAVAQQDANSLYLEAREHLVEERFEEALNLFRSVVQNYPESNRADDAQYYMGYTLERMGKSHEAVEAFEELIRRWPESARVESARSHLVDLIGEREAPSQQLPLSELLSDRTPWEYRREVACALARAGDFSAASILEEIMRRESTSRQQDLIRILGGHLSSPTARNILAIGLDPSRSSSVQLLALRTLKPVAGQPEVTLQVEQAITRNNSSSVQQEAIQVLAPSVAQTHVRRVIIRALERGNSSSVQQMAIRTLSPYLLAEDVRPAIVQLFIRSESSSILHEALNALKDDRDQEAISDVLAAAVDGRNSSSVQLEAMKIARSSQNPAVQRVARRGLDRNLSSSVQMEAVRALAEGRNDQAAAEALERMLKERSISSSVQMEGVRALWNHLETPATARAIAAALDDAKSSSVQLEALDVAEQFATVEPVKAALLKILRPGSTSSSVKLKAVKLLGRHIDDRDTRLMIGQAIHHSNSSSVQLAAIEVLEPASDQSDVREILLGSLTRRHSSSVVLASVRILEDYVRQDPRVMEAFATAMRDRQISSTARVRMAEALLPVADDALKRRIVEAMERVIEQRWTNLRRNRSRYRDDTLYDAIDVVRAIDPRRADELEQRYGRPPSLLQRIFTCIFPEQ